MAWGLYSFHNLTKQWFSNRPTQNIVILYHSTNDWFIMYKNGSYTNIFKIIFYFYCVMYVNTCVSIAGISVCNFMISTWLCINNSVSDSDYNWCVLYYNIIFMKYIRNFAIRTKFISDDRAHRTSPRK